MTTVLSRLKRRWRDEEEKMLPMFWFDAKKKTTHEKFELARFLHFLLAK